MYVPAPQRQSKLGHAPSPNILWFLHVHLLQPHVQVDYHSNIIVDQLYTIHVRIV